MLRKQTSLAFTYEGHHTAMRTSSITLLALASSLALTACSGGGGGATPPVNGGGNTGGGTTLSSQAQSETAVSVANSLGDPVKAMTNFNAGTTGAQVVAVNNNAQATVAQASGTCNNGAEFWSPDKNSDANSTEEQYFYDSACAQLARDIVRIFNVNGTSETVNRTEKQYAINNATPTAQRTDSVSFINGTYDKNGFPSAAAGFARSAAGELDLAGAKTTVDDDELVVMPASGNTSAFCGDAAGYNATGIQNLGETFGWQSAVATGGTRTVKRRRLRDVDGDSHGCDVQRRNRFAFGRHRRREIPPARSRRRSSR